jgi:hypothetical protein
VFVSQPNRRDLLLVMSAAGAEAWAADGTLAGAAHRHLAQASDERRSGPFRARYFRGGEFQLVFRLTDLILPSDGTPGARDAAVAEFLDFYLANSPDAAQASFREGLRWVDATARSKFAKPFVDLREDQQTAILTLISSPANSDPGDLAGVTFFRTLRSLTVFAFYTSKVGIAELGFVGNTFTPEFPGACTHQHEL